MTPRKTPIGQVTVADWALFLSRYTFATAIDDPTRLRKSKDVGQWAGLTQSREETGEREVVGSIAKPETPVRGLRFTKQRM